MATETDTLYPQAQSLMASFNRHGLPGLVIAVLFLMVCGMMYYGVNTLVPLVVNNTKAFVEFTGAVREMKDAIKEQK